MPAEPRADRSELYFRSGDARCHGWLYMPDGTSPEARPPIIVMAHGLGAVKALRLSAFAERFQAKGYACLVFDYRHFGESEGEPRELLSLDRQREDWRAAVAFARSLSEVDARRVVVWGTSFGGGHAIVTAADDADIVAAIAQCPFTDGLASARQMSASWNRTAGCRRREGPARPSSRPSTSTRQGRSPPRRGWADGPPGRSRRLSQIARCFRAERGGLPQ